MVAQVGRAQREGQGERAVAEMNKGKDGGLAGRMIVGRSMSRSSGRHFHLGFLTRERALEGEDQPGDPPVCAVQAFV